MWSGYRTQCLEGSRWVKRLRRCTANCGEKRTEGANAGLVASYRRLPGNRAAFEGCAVVFDRAFGKRGFPGVALWRLLRFALAEAEKGDFHPVVRLLQGDEADGVTAVIHKGEILVRNRNLRVSHLSVFALTTFQAKI
jgi:hypothetical protein